MKRKLPLLLLALIVLTACTPKDEAPLWDFEKTSSRGDWKIYENTRDGYLLTYPREWVRKRFVEEGFTFTAFITEDAGEIITIFTTTVFDPEWSLNGPQLIDSILESEENIQIQREIPFITNTGHPAYRVELLKGVDTDQLRMTLVLIQSRGLVYLIGAQAKPGLYEKYIDLLDQAMSSIKIYSTKEGVSL